MSTDASHQWSHCTGAPDSQASATANTWNMPGMNSQTYHSMLHFYMCVIFSILFSCSHTFLLETAGWWFYLGLPLLWQICLLSRKRLCFCPARPYRFNFSNGPFHTLQLSVTMYTLPSPKLLKLIYYFPLSFLPIPSHYTYQNYTHFYNLNPFPGLL